MNILIVDDNRNDRYLLETILKGCGYSVISAENGKVALEKLEKFKFDMVVSDILMPQMDGFQLCRKVKSDKNLKDIIFVFYTATYTDPQDEELAYKFGADKFIRKPIEPNEFIKIIENTIENAQKGILETENTVAKEEVDYKLYNERLIAKLEQKILELDELKQKYQLIFENVSDVIFLLDMKGNFLSVNQKINQLGYKPESLIGTPFIDILTPEGKEKVLKVFEKGKEKSIRECFGIDVVRGDEALTPIEISITSSYDENNKFLGFFCVARDITKRKKAVQALIDSELRYRRLSELSLDGIAIHSKGKILEANQTFARMFGYKLYEVIGMDVLDFAAPESKDLIREKLESGDKMPFEAIGLRKDGTKFPGEIRARAIPYKNEMVTVSIIRDITEQKRSEEFMKKIFDSISEGLIIVDREYKILSANAAYARMVNSTVSEVIGKYCYQLTHHHTRPCWMEGEECASKHAFDSGEKSSVTHVHKNAKGERYYVEISAYPIKNFNGEIVSAIETLHDVTKRVELEEERKRIEQELFLAQKMESIGQLAGGVAHDFNNQLTVIKGYLDIILKELSENHPFYSDLREVEKAASRAASITSQLLAFSRRQVIQPEVLNLNTVIQNLDKMLKRLVPENIKIKTVLAPELKLVNADETQIEQVIVNLVVNAKDAMPDGGVITIETKNALLDESYTRTYPYVIPGDYVMLSISDTGIGMSPEVKNRIFEPFFTTKEIGKGTGLGLSVVYGIVKQNHGYILVDSEQGKGSIFRIYLPVVEEKEEKDEKNKGVKDFIASGGENKIILLVENEMDIRKYIKRVLESKGYGILEAENGDEALQIFADKSDKIDLVLTDVVMPGISVREMVEKIKEKNPEVKVLYMSGYTDDVITHHGVLEENMDFIQKPFTGEILLERVRAALKKKGS